jgi:hypothetical protein
MKTAASIAGFGEVDDLSCNSFRHDFFFLIIRALSTWLVKIGPSSDMYFFNVISFTKHKA